MSADPNQTSLSADERFSQLDQRITDTQQQIAEVLKLLKQSTPTNGQAMPTERTDGPSPELIPSFVSRRSMLKKAALATLGAAAVWETMPSAKAGGTQGTALISGETNTATASTTLTLNTTSGFYALNVVNSNSSGSGGYGIGASGATGGVFGTTSSGNGVSGFSSTRSGVLGVSVSGSGVYAIAQNLQGSAPGVSAFANSGSGVSGTSGSGAGVSGTSTSGSGLYGTGGKYGAGLTGTVAPLFLNSSTLSTPYADTNDHLPGELYVDSSNELWYCTVGGSPGTWRKVAGSATAGSFALLSAPTRFIDTRTLAESTSSTGTTPPAPGGGVRTYIFSGSGALTPYSSGGTPPSIPYGATGLVGRLTVLNGQNGHSSTSGELKVSNVNPPGFGSGLIIWGSSPASQILPFILALDNSSGDAGKMYFVNTSAADDIDLIVDVTGYYY